MKFFHTRWSSVFKKITPILSPLPILFVFFSLCADATQNNKKHQSIAELLLASNAKDWRPIDITNTLYIELESGRVVVEMAPDFAPNHIQNIKALIQERYFDGLPIVRSQDNYVVQWNDPNGARIATHGKLNLQAEFTVNFNKNMPFTRLYDHDGFAPQIGHSNGFPVAREPKSRRAWLTHCYGMVGAGRNDSIDSGGGAEMYVVTGHAPRHLDKNVTLFGRVLKGMELLTSLPRGTQAMGYFEPKDQTILIKSIRLATEVPANERTNLEIIRTDSKLFQALVERQRNRSGDWFKVPAGYVDLCNVPLLVRPR